MLRKGRRQSVGVLGTLVLLGAMTASAAEGQPAKGPLMTRWAKDVKADQPHPEYPRPQMRRERWQNLNGLWQLAFAKKDETAPIGKDLGEHILVPFPVESALSGVRKHAERLWYRRLFSVPKAWKDQRVLLHLGAVDWEAKVWVNGKEIGSHRGGYDAFRFDITDALKKDGEQELIVGVWDPTNAGTQPRGKQVNKPGGIFYAATTGIWQTVWIEPVPKVHINDLLILPDIDATQVKIGVSIRLLGEPRQFGIHAIVREGDKIVAEHATKSGKPLVLNLPEPKLWSPNHPFLYDLEVDVSEDAKPQSPRLDSVKSYFGMRKISVGPDDKGVTRLLLNNKPYFMVGPLDQGFWPDGLYTAPTDEALKYDIEITKKLGFNMVRKHVKVEPARWYYWCDKLGLLVWQDMPSGDKSIRPKDPDIKRTPESAKQYELELKHMIDGLRNHPSIVMWVVFNEGWGQFDTARITEWTKKYDPSRLVDCASGWTDRGVGDVHDIHVYPGPGSPEPEPKRAAVLGEFGGLGLKVDGHTWEQKTWGYRGASSKADLTRKYEKLLAGVYKLKEQSGLSAAVYTQTTDVETEANGLLTYDRAVIKVDLDRVAAVNKGDLSRIPQSVVVVPTSKDKGLTWRYTLEKPAKSWYESDFNDSNWKEGVGGFGTSRTPGAVVRTVWNTSDIWLRRTFDLPENSPKELHLLLHHDEDTEIYLNGILAAKVKGYVTDYEEVAIDPKALAMLKPGKNTIAVHCKQTGGGQYIDVGFGAYKKK
ncbi:MAG TPA: glycoside hydrolase family 2 TIM barrel-domain containing protein [Gemmataceae bacterium]|nr:glycoside hydrolase family 2 TIM barrel-domain containing protein [Gemmataceae bacterium]